MWLTLPRTRCSTRRLVDDSASMVQGTSMQEMRTICAEVAWIASLFDTTGIDVRFFNSMDQGNVSGARRLIQQLPASTNSAELA